MCNLSKKYIYIILLVVTGYLCKTPSSNKLKFVFILMRSVNRAPLNYYENISSNIENWPNGLGELTNEGIINAYRAGKLLRERYRHFLNPSERYSPSEIDVSSSEVDRCYQTAGYLLAGMYPPDEQQVWNPELLWQPVPIKTSLSKDYHMFGDNALYCPKYWIELHEASEDFIKTEKIKNFINYLRNNTFKTLKTINDALAICDVIWTDYMSKNSIPDWALKRFDDIEKFMLHSMLILNSNSDQMKRLFSGDLVGDIINRMEAIINKSLNAKKMYLHVGHDSTIVPFFNTLNVSEIEYPQFGATVLIELYLTPLNKTLIKLLYNKNYEWKESNIKLIELPGCPLPCGLENWRTLTQKFIPQNLNEECKNS
ncbi:testicular acid phosphatase homolog [Daktulosphaira vitifoliae]|uniref:testicular acid phosphatase homolog n=1 Tax=Daktulosphaira vitifoliae TaxID=58002 RepID=UPI0021AAFDC8|nr:testicular acid phosphatase homolog [Daktulosphaira vitifoliae]